MKKRIAVKNRTPSAPTPPHDIGGLLASLREVIQTARQQAVRAVDVVQVQTGWTVGRHIVEFEQGGEARAEYGARLLPRLAERLTAEFGKGFDERNLWHMCRFYRAFPILNAVRTELSWTHFIELLPIKDPLARDFYAEMCRIERWDVRTLRLKIGDMLFQRTALSRKPDAVISAEIAKLRDGQISTDFVFRDPYLFDLLGLTEACLPWLGQVPGLEEGGSKA